MICAELEFLRHIQQTKNHDSCTVVTLTILRADCILGIDSSASIFSNVRCSEIYVPKSIFSSGAYNTRFHLQTMKFIAGDSHNGFYLLTLFLTVYQLLSRLGVWVWGSGVGGLEVWMAVCMYHTYCGFSQKFFMTQSLVTIWHCLSTCSFYG